MKKLHDLLQNIFPAEQIPQLPQEISGLSLNSRNVKTGNLFIAFPGASSDGRNYINDAIEHGAIAVLQEAENYANQITNNVPILSLPNLRSQTGLIAARFYDHPSAVMDIIGITGTNGKTSCSQFIARALQLAGFPCGVMGTLGYGFPDHLQPTTLTTTDALSLQRQLCELKNQGATAIAMEVSSHSLDQDRVSGIEFDIGVFTNLTQDHLDYHGNMANYAQAKHKLFTQPGLQYAVINLDDDFGRQLSTEFRHKLSTYGYSMSPQKTEIPTVCAHNIQLHPHGFSADITTPWGDGILRSHLLGRFNLSNLLAVLTVLGILQIPVADALNYLAQMPTVDGRMQTFGGKHNLPLVVVDYSHTPDSLEKALTALREHCQGNLWCVFGAGGDRDRTKRPLMGQIAEQQSDKIIITNDNPRTEDPVKIVADIMRGLKSPQMAMVEQDRKAAIAYAISCAGAEDVVLIAGKGHETYQIIGTEKLPFSDAAEVQENFISRESKL